MREAELGSMQRLAVKAELFQHFQVRRAGSAVGRIAEQRVADRRHVDAHLVSAAGLEPAFDQGGLAQRLHDAKAGDGAKKKRRRKRQAQVQPQRKPAPPQGPRPV